MAQMAQTVQTVQTAQVPKNFRTVITAAAGGNVIEWYDFYIFGSLAAILSVKFFEKSHPVAALLSTIALFTAGFLVRPLVWLQTSPSLRPDDALFAQPCRPHD